MTQILPGCTCSTCTAFRAPEQLCDGARAQLPPPPDKAEAEALTPCPPVKSCAKCGKREPIPEDLDWCYACIETKSTGTSECQDVDCHKTAAFASHPVPAADPCDFIETCADHLGEYMGSTGSQKVDHFMVYVIA